MWKWKFNLIFSLRPGSWGEGLKNKAIKYISRNKTRPEKELKLKQVLTYRFAFIDIPDSIRNVSPLNILYVKNLGILVLALLQN